MNARPLGIAMALSLLVHGLAAGAVAPTEDTEKRRIIERVAAFLPPTQVVRTVVSQGIEPAVVVEPPTMVAAAIIAGPTKMPTGDGLASEPSPMRDRSEPAGHKPTRPSTLKSSPVASPRTPRSAQADRRPGTGPDISAVATDVASTPPHEAPSPAVGERREARRGPADASGTAPRQPDAGPDPGPASPSATSGPASPSATSSPASPSAASGPASPSATSGPASPQADATAVRRAWLGRLSQAARRHLRYPHGARRLGLSGESVVAVRFGSNDVPDLAIHVSTGHASLDAAAMAAVAKALRDCPKPAGIDWSHTTSRPVFVPVSFQLQ